MTISDSRFPMPAKTAFIGGGNMARALIGGLVDRGVPAARIAVSDPKPDTRAALAGELGVSTHERNDEAAADADVWLLAVKPQAMRAVCEGLATLAQAHSPLVVSIAAGITTAQLDRWLGGGQAIVRCMPNTPALLGAGATGLHANARVDPARRALAEALLGAVSDTVWIRDEARMDAVTAVSGSGPAYVFLLAEAMEAAGIAQGLPPEAARALTLQTILGAARMLTGSGEPAATLRQRVTSPGGTTQAALETFEAGGFRTLVADAIAAATRRGGELSRAND